MLQWLKDFLQPPGPEGKLKQLTNALETQEERNARLKAILAQRQAESAAREELRQARLVERKLEDDIQSFTPGSFKFSTKRMILLGAAILVLVLVIRACF